MKWKHQLRRDGLLLNRREGLVIFITGMAKTAVITALVTYLKYLKNYLAKKKQIKKKNEG